MGKNQKILLICEVILFIACLGFNIWFSIPYYQMSSVKFQNLDNIRLSAKYAPSENGKGVIIVADLAHDKSELTSMVYELNQLGYGIYIFDYPSQGQSEGNIPFHANNGTYLAEQFYDAMVSYSQLADMQVSDIHVIGYGTGARAILQTISLGYLQPESVTLIGTDINLTDRIQYNILNFTKDTEIDWVNRINQYTGGTFWHLISSHLDNISTNADNEKLAELLQSTPSDGSIGSIANNVTYSKIGYSVHYLLMADVSIMKSTVSYLTALDDLSYTPQNLLYARVPSLAAAFLLLSCIFFTLGKSLKKRFEYKNTQYIAFPEHFVKHKLIAWIPGLLGMVLFPLALYIIPINYPYNDIFRLTLICAYGILMYLLYKFTNFGNDLGKFLFVSDPSKNAKGGLIGGALVIILTGIISLTGMTYLFSYLSKWLWIIIFSISCYFIFYIDEKERRLLADSKRKTLNLLLLNYLILPIAVIIFALIGMYNTSFMVLLEIAILVFVLSTEQLLISINSPTRVNALIKTVLFQMLVFAQSTMFLNQ
ncbi:MAG: hypothetical protein ACC608_00985 [Anaerofustis sp.]